MHAMLLPRRHSSLLQRSEQAQRPDEGLLKPRASDVKPRRRLFLALPVEPPTVWARSSAGLTTVSGGASATRAIR